ncbi:MAG TPA: hypothetical protein VLD83_00365 [Candidatus Binatia bacterium]|nr:hypothetical protein [Candidatus Binatia bacterium]
MNGIALKLRRTIEKHAIIGLDTAPFIYFVEEVAHTPISSIRYLVCWKVMLCAPSPRR